MIAELTTEKAECSLASIVEEVFATMTGTALIHVGSLITPLRDTYAAFISLLCAAPLTIAIECSQSLALAVTRKVLPEKDQQVTENDVRDTVGELINMIGGNFKALMPNETTLTTPCLPEACELRPQSVHSTPLLHLYFASGHGACCISVYPAESMIWPSSPHSSSTKGSTDSALTEGEYGHFTCR